MGFAFPLMAQHFFGEPQDEFFGTTIYEPNNSASSSCLGDLDNDGDLDLLVANIVANWQNWSIRYYENVGTAECPEFEDQGFKSFGIPNMGLFLPTLADIDSDGDLDLFANGGFLKNHGTPEEPDFSGSVLVQNPFGLDFSGIVSGPNVTFADLDKDGDLDAFICGRTSKFFFQYNIGTPAEPLFGPRIANPFGLAFGETPKGPNRIAVADWNCDGILDLLNTIWHIDVPSYPSLTFATWYHEGIPTKGSEILFYPGVQTQDSLFILTHGDVDGDGDEDAISFHHYLENILPDCSIYPTPTALPIADSQGGGVFKFYNQSIWTENDCHPVKWLWKFGDGTTSEEFEPTHTYTTEGQFIARLIVDDQGGLDSLDMLILDDREALLRQALQISPNPASDYVDLTIALDAPMQDVDIAVLDHLGRLVEQRRLAYAGNGVFERFDLSALSDGVYTFRIMLDGMIAGKQFLKTQ